MTTTYEQNLHDLLTAGVTVLIGAIGLAVLVRLLKRSRPGLEIGRQLALAAAVRIA